MEDRKCNEDNSNYDLIINLVKSGRLTQEEEDCLLELLENREQVRKHQIAFEASIKAIEENQLKEEEELEIKQLLIENRQRRERGEEEHLKNASLASMVQFVMEREIRSRSFKETIIKM